MYSKAPFFHPAKRNIPSTDANIKIEYSDMIPSNMHLALSSDISDEDRTFLLVLDMNIMQFNHPADLGYYYVCDCEDSFSFERFTHASEHFEFYQSYKPLRPQQRALVKYINMSKMISNTSELTDKHIIASIVREFNIMKKYNTGDDHIPGIMEVYCLFSRKPNIYYMFMENPEETLDEYIQRRINSYLRHKSSKSNNSERIPQIESQFIMKSVAATLLKLHQKGIIHGKLTINSIFLFR